MVSLSVRITNISLVDIQEMRNVGILLHKFWVKFQSNLSPSMFTLCIIAPEHTIYLYSNFGVGLGMNSMEGREQKHQMVMKYAENSTPQEKWKYVFRHEYIHLIYLRERGYDSKRHISTKSQYLPIAEEGKCECSLRLVDSLCELCNSDIFLNISKSLA